MTAVSLAVSAEATKPAVITPWADKVDKECPWPQYPRPQMVRSQWQNLNGRWDYAILPAGSAQPAEYQGKITVPYAVESYLSGVGDTVGDNNELWYRRTFTVPSGWNGQDVMLNFGAVDWRADVWVNGMKAGSHEGGYTPFSLDITAALKKGVNELVVRVWDPTDAGHQPRGKQVSNPSGIWYTPVTGIWQTVWMEPVPHTRIESLKITPDVDANKLRVKALTSADGVTTSVSVLADGKVVASALALPGQEAEVDMPADVKLWSPASPYLYDLEVAIENNGRTLDKVNSYAAMRKVSVARTDDEKMRFQLNNKTIFHFGPLDQGWWPDGLYTAPTYEAMIYDVDKTKELGFNMIRKHAKVEPALWYAYCDSVGMIVWQDMPSGDVHQSSWQRFDYFEGPEFQRTPQSDACYRKEWKEIIDALCNFPCINVWVPFNEAWGQYNTKATADWTKEYDPTRLVNAASGGNHVPNAGDMVDVHKYPSPKIMMISNKYANVLGEYGGIGLPVEGHLWKADRNWGYTQFKSQAEVTEEYLRYNKALDEQATQAYTGAVYTQTTDVENEVNGFMTYDRKVFKMDLPAVAASNRAIISRHSEE